MKETFTHHHTNGRFVYAIREQIIGSYSKFSIMKHKLDSEQWEYATYFDRWNFKEIEDEFDALVKDCKLKPIK